MDIIDFTAEHAAAFKQLNLAWITEHWTVEAADLKALDSPFESIINVGGAILIGESDSVVVGTVALIPLTAGTLELAKMTVSKTVRGTGLGLALGLAALARAKEMGARKVYLESNTILKPAISLYEKLGFQKLPDDARASPYERCNIRMERAI
jgi:GNAT superfamily N-acetyltransferase